MRIAVDLLTMKGYGGIHRYAMNVLQRLVSSKDFPAELIFFACPELRDSLEAIAGDSEIVEAPVSAHDRIRRSQWQQWRFPSLLPEYGVDLLLTMHGAPPWSVPVPLATVLHDLAQFYPEAGKYNSLQAAYLRHCARQAVANSRIIFTATQYSKDDICQRLKADPERVHVTGAGVDAHIAASDAGEDILRSLNLQPNRYFLYVGFIEPGKNVPALIDAFRRLQNVDDDIALAIVGHPGRGGNKIISSAESGPCANRITFAGTVTDGELATLYQHATAFVFPSLFEGFGMPVIEAMTHGAPVITSTVTSLPEVAGEAALLVDPYDVTAIAQAMQSVLIDEQLRRRLSHAGISRAAAFSWDHTADVFKEALGGLWAQAA